MGYQDPVECMQVLTQLHPLNVDETHRILSEMVPTLLHALPAPDRHLEVLEAARQAVALAQSELARRYASHPLPPDSAENETLRNVVGLWRAMARSYAHIARHAEPGSLSADQRALLAQRRVHYTGLIPMEYFRAHRALASGAWAELHDSYSSAEALGLANIRVTDPLNDIWKAQSPAEAYAAVLLVDLANPFGRGEREFNWVCRWAQRFAPYCGLQGENESDPPKPAAYGLDLSSDHGLRPRGVLPQAGSLRRFDGSQLAGQIQSVLRQFKQGVTPSSLGLGADCPVDACSKLLLSLYRPWGLASAGRRFPRRGSRGLTELCSGWSSVAFHVAGKPFEQPPTYATQRSLRSDISLLTFGERVEQADNRWNKEQRRRTATRLGFTCERWQMADQSVSGFRVQQHPHTQRLEHHQLVGIRPPDGELFLLAQVSWLMYRTDGVMETGVHVLPGVPKVIAVRPYGLAGNVHTGYVEAFMLPATAALKANDSLVLPGRWFQPQRIIDVYDDGNRYQLRLTDLVLRGTDFDQVGFETVNQETPGATQGSAR